MNVYVDEIDARLFLNGFNAIVPGIEGYASDGTQYTRTVQAAM